MTIALSSPRFRAWDTNGDPLAGGKVYFYLAGTNTLTTTYSNPGCTVANSNPVLLNPQGEAVIYLNAAAKIVCKTIDDVTLWTMDDVSTLASLNDIVIAEDYGAVGDGSTDDTAALVAALSTGKTLYLLRGKTYKYNTVLTVPDYGAIEGFGTLYQSASGVGLFPGNYVTLRDFKLLGTYSPNSPASWGISTLYQGGGIPLVRTMADADWSATHLLVENVRIEDFWGGIAPGPYSNVLNCYIKHCRTDGIFFTGDNCNAIGNTIDTVNSWGIDFNANNCKAIGNTLIECGNQAGLVADGYDPEDGGGILANSSFSPNGAEQHDNVIEGNTILGSDLSGIVVQAFTYDLTRVTVEGNTVHDASREILNRIASIACKEYLGATLSACVVSGNPVEPVGNATNVNVYQNTTQPGVVIRDNPGFNPVGAAQYTGGEPALSLSGVSKQNPFSYDCLVTITGGTVSDISLGRNATDIFPTRLTSGSVMVPAGGWIQLTYTVAPAWSWFGM